MVFPILEDTECGYVVPIVFYKAALLVENPCIIYSVFYIFLHITVKQAKNPRI